MGKRHVTALALKLLYKNMRVTTIEKMSEIVFIYLFVVVSSILSTVLGYNEFDRDKKRQICSFSKCLVS